MNTFIFFAFPFALFVIAALFHRKQNKGDIVGGAISFPKSLWLAYTIGAWFFMPFIFFQWNVDEGLLSVYTFHLISFWTRGILELFMIYKWYNWSPRYGISHNIFHLSGIVFLSLYNWPEEVTRATLLALIYIVSFVVSVVFETIFAFLFYKIRGDEKKTIYFASNSKEWLFVNRLTYLAVFICYSLLFVNAFFIRELAL